MANLSERLVVYREVAQSMSRNGANPFLNRLLLISAENIAHWNGLTTPDTNCHAAACLLHAAHDRVPIDTEIGGVVQSSWNGPSMPSRRSTPELTSPHVRRSWSPMRVTISCTPGSFLVG